jgi:hypothetical protein
MTAPWTTALLDQADHLHYADLYDGRLADHLTTLAQDMAGSSPPVLYRFDGGDVVLDHTWTTTHEPLFRITLPAVAVADVDPTDHPAMIRAIHGVAAHAIAIPQLAGNATLEARDAGTRLMADVLHLLSTRAHGFTPNALLHPASLRHPSPFGPARAIVGKVGIDLPETLTDAYGIRGSWTIQNAPAAFASMRLRPLVTVGPFGEVGGMDAMRAAAAPGMAETIDAFAPIVDGLLDGIALDILDAMMDLSAMGPKP